MKSFVRLLESAEVTAGQVSNLLQFYAVECGLKAAALRRRNLQRTDQLPSDLLSHDLRRLAKELRLTPAAYQRLVDCKRVAVANAPAPPVAVAQLHEAWRYGAGLDAGGERSCVAGLVSLGQWCRKELGR
ncbi:MULTISPECIES: hypothetical protein [unclassified Solwaraspora]|uniref:hypothetical protein n=1 Tax=unclassified Solwaraspora TaxID=2627926 RepID=UPI00248CE137|nr:MULTISPECIES: hypothetical protein [unclassified Solwaraspora]WBB95955.1 hypothetical protein O7553_21745 [Solwaraspora sp. WMMA2059]WBC20141.1 hypothetical protein O7543_25630 [Solwaraspora sp. WMMA2080]WJK32272.1 hypothetical protein O7610_15935 [Solwaraspora sp. WMMA2065]